MCDKSNNDTSYKVQNKATIGLHTKWIQFPGYIENSRPDTLAGSYLLDSTVMLKKEEAL